MPTDQTEKEFVDSFNFDTSITGDVKRKYLAHYVNTEKLVTDSTSTQTYTWELLGYKVSDASIEFNWDEEKIEDITGTTYNTIKKSEPTITLDGYIIKSDSKFLENLAKKAIRNAYTEFNNETLLTVYFWLSKQIEIGEGNNKTSKTVYLAKRETDCSIVPSSIGGEGILGISPIITFSNKAKFGYVEQGVDTEASKITFTERPAT